MKSRFDRATTKNHWIEYYSSHAREAEEWQPIDESNFRNYPHLSLMGLLKRYVRGDVIEIGAGDSQMLIELQKRFHPNRVVGLDYLPEACDMLRKKARLADAPIEVFCADLYAPPTSLLNAFDLVMTYGVVEHFTDLTGVVAAISRFSKPGGVVFTLIPNVKGSIYQKLMKSWNRKVYDAHVPYDSIDLASAHVKAGLIVEDCFYFLSSNFGLLSWCFIDRPKSGPAYQSYFWLTRLSKLGWWFEQKVMPLPATRWFAPYIVCVAKKMDS